MYVGVYRDGTGWSKAAQDYILSLDAADVEVVPRPLKLNDSRYPIPKRIEELEDRSAVGCDAVIQHVLPHQMEYDSRCGKNIGLFASETSNFRATPWPERLNLMDEVWVINRQQAEACKASGITRLVRVVPHATDITRFQRNYEPLPDLKANLEGNFAFYTIGELVRRKNLPALLKAFHLEFAPSEPVSLVIKASLPGGTPEQSAQKVLEVTTEVKRALKLYPSAEHYHREHVITQRFSEEAMMRLHATCDCFVSASFGEAWCLPAFDAMAMGKTPIVPNSTGFRDYISWPKQPMVGNEWAAASWEKSGILVDCRPEPVFGVFDTFTELFTGREEWGAVSIPHLRSTMRTVYESAQLRAKVSEAGMERAYDFSYEKIGQQMRKFLES